MFPTPAFLLRNARAAPSTGTVCPSARRAGTAAPVNRYCAAAPAPPAGYLGIVVTGTSMASIITARSWAPHEPGASAASDTFSAAAAA
jgi:hypothetical protein